MKYRIARQTRPRFLARPGLFALMLLTTAAAFLSNARADDGPGDLLKELVEIPSGTSEIDGVNQVQKIVRRKLETWGFAVELKKNPLNGQNGASKSGELLVATLPGDEKTFVTFVGHADTVFEASSGFSGYVIENSDSEKIARGPGVIDDKGGLVVMLEGIQKYLENHKKPKFSFRVVVSPSEETGSAGFLDDFRKFSLDSKLVLGFEPSLDDGSIVTSRRGNRWYLIEVTGREAHAGRDHKKGINACLDLATKLEKISALTDYRKNVTVSIGHIEGGADKFNIVCGSAQAKVDTRFGDLKSREQLTGKIEKILKKPTVESAEDRVPAKIEFEIADDCPPFSVSREAQPVIEKYEAALLDVEKIKSQDKSSGGSADSNYFSRPGVVVIDGLGPTGGGMHTKEEHLRLSTLESRARALSAFLEAY